MTPTRWLFMFVLVILFVSMGIADGRDVIHPLSRLIMVGSP